MAFYSQKLSGTTGTIFNRAAALVAREWQAMQTALVRRRVFYTTLNELAGLSDRDLSDIGLSRADIRGIAYQEAVKAH